LKAHVVGVEASDSIGTSSAIFQERGDGLGGRLGSLCLGGCECAKGNAESVVEGTRVVACGNGVESSSSNVS
jgi:hypothetical protein